MKKIITILFLCTIFFACKKSNFSTQATYPKVSYDLHTNLKNQVYDYSHSSVYVRGTGLFDNWIYWDNRRDGTDVKNHYACEAGNQGTFYRINFYDTAAYYYDTVNLLSYNTRSILSFKLPSIKNIINQNDTSVLIYIRDTSYSGHAVINLNISSLDDVSLAEPEPTMNGTFNMSGIVSNGYSPDSVAFSSSGKFINMPYR